MPRRLALRDSRRAATSGFRAGFVVTLPPLTSRCLPLVTLIWVRRAGCATQTQLRQSSGVTATRAHGNGRRSHAHAAAALAAAAPSTAAARRTLSAGPAASLTSGRVRGYVTAATAASGVRVRCVLLLGVCPSHATHYSRYYSPLAWHAITRGKDEKLSLSSETRGAHAKDGGAPHWCVSLTC